MWSNPLTDLPDFFYGWFRSRLLSACDKCVEMFRSAFCYGFRIFWLSAIFKQFTAVISRSDFGQPMCDLRTERGLAIFLNNAADIGPDDIQRSRGISHRINIAHVQRIRADQEIRIGFLEF